MKVTDCVWEIDNLGVKTCEVVCENDEIIEERELNDLEKTFKYIVVKVSKGLFRNFEILSKNGYIFNEAQLSVSKQFKNFVSNDKLVNYCLNKTYLSKCNDKTELDFVLDKMNGVFDTDRIAINPNFGIDLGNKRYRNWIDGEFGNSNFYLYRIMSNDSCVGFCSFKKHESYIDYQLGGLFDGYRNSGLGLIIPLCPYKHMLLSEGMEKLCCKTKISSNNPNVVNCYLYCGYRIDEVCYVFTKNL